jgi:hypothetical protein
VRLSQVLSFSGGLSERYDPTSKNDPGSPIASVVGV